MKTLNLPPVFSQIQQAGINMGAQRWKAQKRQLWDLWGLTQKGQRFVLAGVSEEGLNTLAIYFLLVCELWWGRADHSPSKLLTEPGALSAMGGYQVELFSSLIIYPTRNYCALVSIY